MLFRHIADFSGRAKIFFVFPALLRQWLGCCQNYLVGLDCLFLRARLLLSSHWLQWHNAMECVCHRPKGRIFLFLWGLDVMEWTVGLRLIKEVYPLPCDWDWLGQLQRVREWRFYFWQAPRWDQWYYRFIFGMFIRFRFWTRLFMSWVLALVRLKFHWADCPFRLFIIFRLGA